MSPDAALARRAFRALAAPLGRSQAGTGALEWLRPETVDGLGLDLAGALPRVLVHVAEGWPLSLVPRWLETPRGRLPLLARHVPRPRLHCAAISVDAGRAIVHGSAGFLANDVFAPGANFLVTAGHVLGANINGGFDDPITIEALEAGVRIERAVLAETATPLDRNAPNTLAGPFPVDAGLIRLRPADWQRLIDAVPALMPAGVVTTPPAVGADLRVLLTGGRVLQGHALREEAMVNFNVEQVQPDGNVTKVELRIDALNSFHLDDESVHGYSGAPVRDADDRLVGIHCAYRAGADAEVGNALYTPIQPILHHFNILPLTQANRNAPPAMRARPPLRAALARPALIAPPAAPTPRATDAEAVDTLARTLWAEARGEGDDGMAAVACVVLNRVASPRWWGRNIVEVCRKPSQFSCWNEGSASRAALLAVTASDPFFVRATTIARRAVDGGLADFTHGALHYHAIEVLPRWARGRTPCFTLGRHVFYNDIERSSP